MKKWRTLALVGTSQEAAYYNLGAFAQSSRRGITKASEQFGSILCRVNSWLSMLFPLGTWSSLCISHNELLKLHQDLTNAPGALNYTVSLGDFSGGGLLLESPSGALRLPLPTSGEMKHFAICDTKSRPLAFDGTLWHGTEEFAGDRWVVTAYTCRHLEELSAEDVARLRGDTRACSHLFEAYFPHDTCLHCSMRAQSLWPCHKFCDSWAPLFICVSSLEQALEL